MTADHGLVVGASVAPVPPVSVPPVSVPPVSVPPVSEPGWPCVCDVPVDDDDALADDDALDDDDDALADDDDALDDDDPPVAAGLGFDEGAAAGA